MLIEDLKKLFTWIMPITSTDDEDEDDENPNILDRVREVENCLRKIEEQEKNFSDETAKVKDALLIWVKEYLPYLTFEEMEKSVPFWQEQIDNLTAWRYLTENEKEEKNALFKKMQECRRDGNPQTKKKMDALIEEFLAVKESHQATVMEWSSIKRACKKYRLIEDNEHAERDTRDEYSTRDERGTRDEKEEEEWDFER